MQAIEWTGFKITLMFQAEIRKKNGLAGPGPKSCIFLWAGISIFLSGQDEIFIFTLGQANIATFVDPGLKNAVLADI